MIRKIKSTSDFTSMDTLKRALEMRIRSQRDSGETNIRQTPTRAREDGREDLSELPFGPDLRVNQQAAPQIPAVLQAQAELPFMPAFNNNDEQRDLYALPFRPDRRVNQQAAPQIPEALQLALQAAALRVPAPPQVQAPFMPLLNNNDADNGRIHLAPRPSDRFSNP